MQISGLKANFYNKKNKKPSFGCLMMAMVQTKPPTVEDNIVRNELLYNNPLSLKNQSAPGLKYRDGSQRAYNTEDLFTLYYKNGNADGWGIVSYNNIYKGQPYVYKSPLAAFSDPDYFAAVNNLNYIRPSVTLAHVRQATAGGLNKDNSHPFVYKNWSFEHNGALGSALSREVKDKIYGEYAKLLGGKPEGQTDSEHAFYYFLGNLQKSYGTTDTKQIGIEKVKKTFAKSLVELINRSPESHRKLDGTVAGLKGSMDLSPACNVIASDGENVYAFKKGHTLYYGRYINSQGDPMYMVVSEKPNKTATPHQIEWVAVPEEHVVTIARNKEGKYEATLDAISDLVPEYNKLSEHRKD